MANIKTQGKTFKVFYIIFAVLTLFILFYYLSNTLLHFTTPRQFEINSFERFPLTFLIFPAELFAFAFALYFVYNLLTDDRVEKRPSMTSEIKNSSVAILLPVFNEPKEIIERTLRAVVKLKWKKINIYLLDDSNNDEDRGVVNELGRKYGAKVVRRPNNVGYKAGNINNAVRHAVKEKYFVVLDSDQAPEPEFLEETMPFFVKDDVGFVQVPQHFINEKTPLERAAKLGTNIFYRAQGISKAKDGAIPFCGTNVVVRTDVFERVGGLAYYTATEDIDLGIRINSAGYRGAYVPKILVKGYAPPDFKGWTSQQYRWSNGNLAILRENWLKLFGGNFSLRYQVHMFFTIAWWLIGIVTLMYILVPVLSVLFGLGTHHTWLPSALLVFLFFHVALGITMIYASLKSRVDEDDVTFKDAFLEYSLIVNSMFIYTRAAINALVFKKYIGFVRTNKKGSLSKYGLIKWNLILGAICFVLSIWTLYNAMLSSDLQQLRTNLPLSLWLLFYSVILFSSIIFVGGRK